MAETNNPVHVEGGASGCTSGAFRAPLIFPVQVLVPEWFGSIRFPDGTIFSCGEMVPRTAIFLRHV